jgi:hypothetical protein
MREGLRLRRQHAEDVFMLRYEELASSPAASLGAILEVCRLDPDPTMISYAETILRTPNAAPRHHFPQFVQQPFTDMQTRLGYD